MEEFRKERNKLRKEILRTYRIPKLIKGVKQMKSPQEGYYIFNLTDKNTTVVVGFTKDDDVKLSFYGGQEIVHVTISKSVFLMFLHLMKGLERDDEQVRKIKNEMV